MDIFDWKFYLTTYRDLQNAGLTTEVAAKRHWVQFGRKEGRLCNAIMMKTRYEKNLLDATNAVSQYVGSTKANPKWNILIRTCMRETYFRTCMESILKQTYKNYHIIVSYDDVNCLKYLNDYDIEHHFVDVDSGKPYKFNLYCNTLLDHVTDGWIMFLDDDDMLLHENTLQIMSDHIETENDLLIWKFLRPDKVIFPVDIQEIKLGEIASCGYGFHSTHKSIARWPDMPYGDYAFFNELMMKRVFDRKFIPVALTKTIFVDRIGNYGERVILV